MKYLFMEKMLKNDVSMKDVSQDSHEIKKYKESQRFQFSISALSMMAFMYICIILDSEIQDYPQLTFSFYLALSGFMSMIILGIVLILFRQNKFLHVLIRWTVFIIFYSSQLVKTIELIVVDREEFREIRNILSTFFSSFYLVIFFKFNYVFISIICLINLGLMLFLQIYNLTRTDYGHYYIIEFSFSLLMPTACIIARYQYEKMINIIQQNIKLNQRVMRYIDSVIDQLPCFYLSYSQGKVVYTNKTLQEFLEHNSSSSNGIGASAIENNNNNLLIINNLTSGRFLENNNLITDNNALNAHENNTVSIGSADYLVKEFLNNAHMSFIEPKIKDLIDFNYEKINLLSLVSLIDNNDSSLIVNFFAQEKFYFLGVNEFMNTKSGLKYYHQVSCRRMSTNGVSWIELILTDITFSQRIKVMEETYKMKESILAKIAHEFKTPLMCVAGLSEEIQSKMEADAVYNSNDEEIKSKMSHINDLSNYTLFLTNDIMNYLNKSRISQIPLKLENFKLNEMMNFCYRILVTLLVYNKNKINSVKPLMEIDEDVSVYSDQIRIKQILLNLISNAVKFTKKGFIKLKSVVNTQWLTISVEDTGMGIKEEDLNKIFTEESMLKDHLTENPMGSGLGLSISNMIAKNMKCSLDFTSKYEKGSKFSIKIPIDNDVSKRMNVAFSKIKEIPMPTYKSNFYKRRVSGQIDNINMQDWNLKVNNKIVSSFERRIKSISYNKASSFRNIQSHNPNSLSEVKMPMQNILDNTSNNNNNNVLLIDKQDTDLNNTLNTQFLDICLEISESKKLSKFYQDEEENFEDSPYKPSSDNSKNTNFNGKHNHQHSGHNMNLFNSINNSFIVKSTVLSNSLIVIIDDTPVILDSIERVVKKVLAKMNKTDVTIVKGYDGVDLLRLVVEDANFNRIKCIFTDENMEFMNGSEATRIIRGLEVENKISKQIICNISAASEEKTESKKLFNFIMEKPLSQNTVEDLLSSLDL